MLDINYIRDNLEKVRKSIQARKAGVDLDQLLRLDESRRDLIQKVDALRAKRNEAAKAKDIEAGKKIKGELDSLEKQLGKTEKEWNSLMLQVPNILLDEVPIGDVSKNKTIEKVGELPEFSFKPKEES